VFLYGSGGLCLGYAVQTAFQVKSTVNSKIIFMVLATIVLLALTTISQGLLLSFNSRLTRPQYWTLDMILLRC
jgi:hypothetical protein